jgi:prepilin-type N-terminal cleavage/methylation domain-containing protein
MKHKGFTVLEFLVVVAIMAILVGLILVGLNVARANARDQEKIANLQRIALGIQQYHDICRQYPSDIDGQETCLDMNGSTFETLVPDIMNFSVNQIPTGQNQIIYGYAPIALDQNDLDTCSGFHLWVKLERTNNTIEASRANSVGTAQCLSATNPHTVDASTDHTIFDIHSYQHQQ